MRQVARLGSPSKPPRCDSRRQPLFKISFVELFDIWQELRRNVSLRIDHRLASPGNFNGQAVGGSELSEVILRNHGGK